MDLRCPRITFEQPVLLQPEGITSSLTGRARNLSQGGLFVSDLEALPPIDSQLQLSFALPDGQAIEAEATVRRRILADSPLEPQGVALSFCSVEGEYAEHLRDFIDEELTSPDAASDKIKLKLDRPDVVIAATARSVSDELLVAECSLPFLRVGSELMVQRPAGQAPQPGVMSWVSMHLAPRGQVPKIIIGVDTSGRDAAEVVAASYAAQAPSPIVDRKPGRDDPPTLLVAAPHFTPVRRQRNTALKVALAASLAALALLGGWVFGPQLMAGLGLADGPASQATVQGAAPEQRPAQTGVVAPTAVAPTAVAPTALAPQPPALLPPISTPAPAVAPTDGSIEAATPTDEAPLPVVVPEVIERPIAALPPRRVVKTTRRQKILRARRRRRRRARLKQLRRVKNRRLAAVKVLLTRAANARTRGRSAEARRLALEALELDPGNLQARELLLGMWRKGTPKPQ